LREGKVVIIFLLNIDTWQLGWRHGDVAASNYAFYKGIGAELGWSDPVFQKRMAERGLSKEKNPVETGQLWIDQVWHGEYSDKPTATHRLTIASAFQAKLSPGTISLGKRQRD
jgi:hypothetical protein